MSALERLETVVGSYRALILKFVQLHDIFNAALESQSMIVYRRSSSKYVIYITCFLPKHVFDLANPINEACWSLMFRALLGQYRCSFRVLCR